MNAWMNEGFSGRTCWPSSMRLIAFAPMAGMIMVGIDG
jgi:hypothetical protein